MQLYSFPSADPIPLPAPVWLFKFLHNLTLTLHLAAVELLLGGLILGLCFSLLGRGGRWPAMTQAGGMIAHRLPALMSMLINLGVPPLLFAQVLYGRALYTSSVLIGAYWIAVIFLLMASYYGLYAAAKQASAKKQWTAPGLAALLLALTIAFIYSNNMTLMLRPQVWGEMYARSPAGVQWNTGDATLLPRWSFFVLGSLAAAGMALMLLSLRSHFDAVLRRFLFRAGGGAVAVGLLLQLLFGGMAMVAQPDAVGNGIAADALYRPLGYVFAAAAGAGLALGLWACVSQAPKAVTAVGASGAGLTGLASVVLLRDGIRDLTLRAAGFEVWNRQVATNWPVVALFLALLVAAAAMIGYLIWVLANASRVEERYV
ncbi:MAG: hypothetical protein JST93_21530 [Acidobacteria bacterium]|nr:hypothetical protein [Acidobacteriota bacterium]